MSNKEFTALAVGFVALFAVTYYFTQCDEGGCLKQAQNGRPANFIECMAAGNPVMESYPRQCRLPDGTLFVENLGGNAEPAGRADIHVDEPMPNAKVGLPLTVRGQATTFESQVNYRLRDEDGSILAEGFTTAASPGVGQPGDFSVTITYPKPYGTRGMVEVFSISAADGSEIGMVAIPVEFVPTETQAVNVYFLDMLQDPDRTQCDVVHAFERRVPSGSNAPRFALEELLKGPTNKEMLDGIQTSIPAGVRINALLVENGTATADLDDTLQRGIGGACRVTAIRAQIEQTLRQFPEVQNVVISINGETEEILQP